MKEQYSQSSKKTSILIIDDDADDTLSLTSAINTVIPGASIKTFSNSSDATDFLYKEEQSEPAADLIFLDLNMNKLDGRAVLCLIKVDKKLSDIPVIVLSSSSDPFEKKELLNLGASEFFTKPTRDKNLVELIESIKNKWLNRVKEK